MEVVLTLVTRHNVLCILITFVTARDRLLAGPALPVHFDMRAVDARFRAINARVAERGELGLFTLQTLHVLVFFFALYTFVVELLAGHALVILHLDIIVFAFLTCQIGIAICTALAATLAMLFFMALFACRTCYLIITRILTAYLAVSDQLFAGLACYFIPFNNKGMIVFALLTFCIICTAVKAIFNGAFFALFVCNNSI